MPPTKKEQPPAAPTPKLPSKGRAPDYDLVARAPNADRGTVGSAWLDEEGTIAIRLNPGVVLQRGEYTLRLYPKVKREKA